MERDRDVSGSSDRPCTAPRFPARVLRWLLRRRWVDTLIADLDEEYTVLVRPRVGRMRAGLWYWRQVVSSVFFARVAHAPRRARSEPTHSTPRTPKGRPMSNLLNDLRFTLRGLRRNPVFAIMAIATLALGTGPNVALLTVVDRVLLQPLSFPEPDELVVLWTTTSEGSRTEGPVSQVNFRDWQSQSRTVSMAAYAPTNGVTVSAGGEAEIIPSSRVSEGLLSVFGHEPALGRDIRPEENVPGGPRVAVVGHGFWQTRLGGDPQAIGRTILLNEVPFEVVGVAPQGFAFPGDTQLWIPRYVNTESCGRGCRIFNVIGRLGPESTVDAAQEELSLIASRLADQYPDTNAGLGVRVVPLHDVVLGDVRTPLFLILGAATLVLLIACANVASLLIVRFHARAREISVRTALGAGRRRLMQQLSTEVAVLTLIGGFVGLGLAWGVIGSIQALAPGTLPRIETLALDPTVLLYALGVTGFTAMACGLVPALRLSRTSATSSLSKATGFSGRMGGRWFRSTVLGGQVAVSLMLLLGAGLLLQSFHARRSVDLGYTTEHVTRFMIDLPGRYDGPPEITQFFATLEEELEGISGVLSVGSIVGTPLGGRNTVRPGTTLPDHPDRPEFIPLERIVTPRYFETMGIPVLEGRGFDDRDRADSEPVVVINERLAEEIFPDMDPIGERVLLGITLGLPERPRRIVGIVADVRSLELEANPSPELYVPQSQVGVDVMTLMIRSEPEAGEIFPTIRETVAALDPNVALRNIETMEEVVTRSLASGRFYLFIIGSFSLLAVFLAGVGLYGVVAHSVGRRTREIGIRVAIGAPSSRVVRTVLSETSVPAMIGIVVGIAGSIFGAELMSGLLYGVEPQDSRTLIMATVSLAAVVAVATLLPARRAATIPATEALREE